MIFYLNVALKGAALSRDRHAMTSNRGTQDGFT